MKKNLSAGGLPSFRRDWGRCYHAIRNLLLSHYNPF